MKKLLIGFAVLVLLLVVALIAVPYLFKDKIHGIIKEQINEQVNAKVDYSDVGISLIKNFPDFTLTLSSFNVVGVDSFKGDTLTHIGEFVFTIDVMSVIKGQTIVIKKIALKDMDVDAITNYEGKSNWDIMKPSDPKKSSGASEPLALNIKRYSISNGNIFFTDKQAGTNASVSNLQFEGSGDISSDNYTFATKTSASDVSFKSGGVPYLSKAKIESVFDIDIDSKNKKYTFGNNNIKVNDLELKFKGAVALKDDDIKLDVSFSSPQTSFKNILSLIPAIYKKDFEQVKTSGKLALKGEVKGTYNKTNYPSFLLDLKVTDGMFQYPSLPVAVKNIQITTNVSKPEGPLDLLKVNISKLHLEAGTEPIDARIFITKPISNPTVDASIHGKLNLANVSKFYPLEGVKKLEGIVLADLDFAGSQSDIDNKRFEAVKADGTLDVKGLVYDADNTPMPVRINIAKLNFNPKSVELSSLIASIGRSDFNANGSLGNFVAYAFDKGELYGKLNLRSNNFDANEFLQKENSTTTTAKDTSPTVYFKVPPMINFTLTSTFGKIAYDKLMLTNVSGIVTVKDEAIRLQDLNAQLLGGSATISAMYDTKNTDKPRVTFSYDIKNFDFQQTFKLAEMSEKLAPIIKYVEGSFSSDLKGTGSLNSDMSLDYNSLNGDGKVEIPYAKIVNVPLLSEITKVAKIPALQNLEIKNGWTVLKFKDGKVFVEPTDFKFGNGYNMNVQGANAFDKTIDYVLRLDVPSSQLGTAASTAQSMLPKVPGVNFSMPEVVNFYLKATGTAEKPKISLLKVGAGGSSAKDMAKQAVEDLKTKAEEEARKKANELKQQAEAELQKQKAEAEKRVRDAAQKAKEDAERQAREAAEKAKKEAEKKARDLFKFPK